MSNLKPVTFNIEKKKVFSFCPFSLLEDLHPSHPPRVQNKLSGESALDYNFAQYLTWDILTSTTYTIQEIMLKNV